MRLFFLILFFQSAHLFGQEIEKNIFGFATSNTFTYFNVLDTSFVNKVNKLNPQILRFPGGAVGNFYHFDKSGYGFDFNEIDQYHDGKFPKRSRGLESARKKNKHQHNYINDFIELAKKTNAKAVLVANPFGDNDNDIILMINKLHANNIKVVGVELGSELSNRSYFLKGYTIEDYILFAQRCSKLIKNHFPEIKIAVVAAPLGKKKGHRHNIWNKKLSSMNFYDAIIIHSYAQVIKGDALDGQMVFEEIERNNKKQEFQIYKDRVITYFNNHYPKEVQEYSNLYNKPIWVTEWNLHISKTTGNTLLQSLFVAQYILEALSNSKLSSIELTTYHNLAGRDVSGSIFRNNKEKVEIQSTYYPMMMIGKIFENNIFRIEKFTNQETFLYKCYDQYNKEILSYKLDWGSCKLICEDYSQKSECFSIVYKSDNLSDKANTLGLLNFKIYESCE